jgi:hypothetical protein
MAKFLVLIYGDEQVWEEASASEGWREQNEAGHRAFNAAAGSAVLGGHELESTTKAVCLRAGDQGRPVVTDGPFVETKEVIGGYYVLEAADLDAAIALASRLPEVSAPTSGVEIRPIVG